MKRKIGEEIEENKEEKKIKRRPKSFARPPLLQKSLKLSLTSEKDLLVLLYHAIKLSAQTLRTPDAHVSYPSRYGSTTSVSTGERENCWHQDRGECSKHPGCVLGPTVGAVGGRERKRLRTLATSPTSLTSLTSETDLASIDDENYLCEYAADLQPYWLGSVIEVPAYSRNYFRLVGIAESAGGSSAGTHLPALFFEDVSTNIVYLTFAPMTELYESKEYPKNFQAMGRYFCGRWMVAPYKDNKNNDKLLENVFIHGGTWEHWQSLTRQIQI